MKILHIITHYYPHVYGAEQFVQQAAEFQSTGQEVSVLTGRWKSEWLPEEVINGVTVYRTPVIKIRYLQTILAVIPFVWFALYLHRRQHFEVIHTHIYPGMIVGAVLKRFSNSFKFIATIQGGDIGDYPEVFGSFAKVARKLIGWCLQQADRVHCVSSYLQNEVIKLGVEPDRIQVIPNGVDITKFKSKHLKSGITEKNSKELTLISTSRLEAKNNLSQLIEVIAELRERGFSISLDIYGTGSLYSHLKSEITNLSLQKKVHLKGYLPHTQLPAVLPAYDFFIRLSNQEGFGISFIEAMACGIVPIGTPVGGIVDIIDNGVNGFLVNLKVNSVANQLEKIFLSHGLGTIQKNARKTVVEKFTWDQVLSQVQTLYLKKDS